MYYTTVTEQYGEFIDEYHHDNIDDLLNDLVTISEMPSVHLLDIKRDGKSLSKTRIKVLVCLARNYGIKGLSVSFPS